MSYKDIEQLLNYVNENIKNGGSVAQAERDLGFGKDTLRKRLNRANYRYDRSLKQFVLQDNTDITQGNSTITQVKKDNVLQDNTHVTHRIKENVTHDNTNITQYISNEEIDILKSIVRNYKNLRIEKVELKGKIVTRSFRTYEKVVDKFVKYCSDNNFVQKDAIAQAMLDFMDKENKTQ